jgi:hypothetical protein
MRNRIIAVALLGALGVANADTPADAIALFDQGIKDMQAGKYELACRELSASLVKYPDSGTKGALAECYTQLGKVASAWKLWKDLADTAPLNLRAEAAANAAALEPRLPRYVLQLTAVTPGITVTINSTNVADPTLAVPLPLDPGEVIATAYAPQYKSWQQRFQAREGATVTIEVPALEPLPPAPEPKSPTTVQQPTVAPTAYVDNSSARTTRHVIGGAAVVVGLAAVGAGAYFGSTASSKWQSAQDRCGGSIDTCAFEDIGPAQTDVDDARSAATKSTWSFVGGGILVAAGAVVWFTAPSKESRVVVAPALGAHSSGLTLSGSF